MNFQGRLTDSSGTTMPDGLYNMKFRLFTVASGGSDVWNETRETTNRVQVTNGLFSVQLGAVTPISASLFASGSLYFEVELPTPATATCGTGSCQTWTEGPMTTRSILSTSAYAFNSETLDGLDSTGFIQNQDSSVQTAAKLWIGGTARVDTSILAPLLDTATATTLEIGTTNATSISLKKDTTLAAGNSLTLIGGVYGTRPASPTAGMLYYDTTSNQLLQYNGTKWVSDRSTATKIVAASNSSQSDKDAADYVADGNTGAAADGDQVQINAALTAAVGKKVILLAGTYTVDASISVPNNTTLTGVGTGTVIAIPNNFNASINAIVNTDTTTGTGITINDLKIDGNKANQTSGTQRGISIDTAINTTIADTTVQNMRSDGMYVTDYSNSIKITDNIFADNGSAGLSLDQYEYYATITGNIMRDNGGVGLYALRLESSTVSGNVFEANTTTGVYAENASDNTFTANTIGDNSDSGFVLHNSNNNTVSGNKIHDNSGSANNNGIYVNASDGNTITGNDITDTAATTNYAINISNNTSDKNYLADNRFSSTPGDSTINDAGTGTVYANQPTAENGMNLLNRTLNSTSAFSIQGTDKVNVFNIDTTNGELEIGNYNGGTNAVNGKLVMGNSTNANLVSLVSGATGTSYTLTLPTAVGASGDCLKTSDASGTLTFGACAAGGGVTSVGAFSGSSIAN
ncbi:MAG: right-handed parallel beta-helix repeat-containing protein, partial [Candidatus Saccharimonadaceae bacterium]